MKLCGFDVGLDQRFFLIAGPCVIESEQSALDIAGTLKEITGSGFFVPPNGLHSSLRAKR